MNFLCNLYIRLNITSNNTREQHTHKKKRNRNHELLASETGEVESGRDSTFSRICAHL